MTNVAITGAPFSYRDLDKDGGQPRAFLNSGADSNINLMSNTTYKTRMVILNESKTPTDSTSNIVAGDESNEHMFFYNGNPANNSDDNGNTIIKNSCPNCSVKLNG